MESDYLSSNPEPEINRTEGNVLYFLHLHFKALSIEEFLFQTQTHGTPEVTGVCVCFQGVSPCQSLCFHS